MQSLNQPEAVKKQYQTADKLNIRISLHHKYSTNHQGFGNWILSHYRLEPGMAVLEQNIINGVLTIPKEYGMFIAR